MENDGPIKADDWESIRKWSTGVKCEKCDDILLCSTDKVEKKFVTYLYHCETCNVEGPWTALAIRHLGNYEAARQRKPFKSKRMAPRQF